MTKADRKPPSENDLPALPDSAMGRDRTALQRQLSLIAKRRAGGKPFDRAQARFDQLLADSAAERELRDQTPLCLQFDDALPISAHVDELVRAITDHPVVVVAGETGSGKTTQLPKACWLAGRGRDGWIGCTQPRRIAARTIAARLAEELAVEVGGAVGYQVRFDQQVTPQSLIKVMTDGILLAETQHDRDLMAYDTLIIDEAHERSLNIDFLLGYLKRLLPRRPDLRVIITSATIDTQRFSEHFDDAPVIEVSGRGYPVEIRYRPLDPEEGEARDLNDAIVHAVEELDRVDPRGDTLVFLPGERDIREASEALGKAGLRHTEILPLYSRLSNTEQNRIFHPGRARRIVLATNVAETSLTVPRIRFVIDSGLARISRYSHRSKVQRLPIEPISQASANQRAGRCGRLGPGVCIRLFDEPDFLGRPEYTDPEILRTNLAAVILQMALLRLGDIEDFPFLQPPEQRFIRDGVALLQELRAMDSDGRLTPIGRDMARWPLDVRLARLVLAGFEQDCGDNALVLAAFLSLADPRERPLEAQQAADEKHRQWHDPRSDLATVLNLWQDFRKQRASLGGSALRRWCKENFLSYPRMREWHDIWRQLGQQARESGLADTGKRPAPATTTEKAEPQAADEALHRAFVTAFLGHVGVKQESGYLGVRDRRYDIFPGSGLFNRGPKWMVSAFLVETARLYARLNAAIDPAWAEQAGRHLLKKRQFDPHWSPKAGRVNGYEQVSLYGLVLVAKRRIHYGPHDPQGAREIMIREGLVPGLVRSRFGFVDHNRRVIDQVEALEQRARRRDLKVADPTLARWFDARLPPGVYTARALDQWLAQNEAGDEILRWTLDDVTTDSMGQVDLSDFPEQIEQRGVVIPVSYVMAPGQRDDGATLTVPLHVLNLLRPEPLEWGISGWLHDKVVALIKSLPKPKRRAVVPAPDFAAAFLHQNFDRKRSLLIQLANFLSRDTQIDIAPKDFEPDQIEPWLHFRLVVMDGERRVDEGRDLKRIQKRWADAAQEQFVRRARQALKVEQRTSWDFAALPETIELDGQITAWPALVDQADSVGVRVFDTPGQARAWHRHGLRRLLVLRLKDKVRYLRRHLGVDSAMALKYAAVDSATALDADLVFAVSMSLVDSFLAANDQPVRDADQFEKLVDYARPALVERATELVAATAAILDQFHELRSLLDEELEKLAPASVADMRQQLDYLVYPGFLTEVPQTALDYYPRYLEAMKRRIDRLRADPARDRKRHGQIAGFWNDYLARCQAGDDYPDALDRFHWLLEEYRVSLFAQELKTVEPVSAKRLKSAWAEVPPP